MSVGKVIARIGRVPHIAWWRLMHMTDIQIEEHANKHLIEEELIMKQEDVEKQVDNHKNRYAIEVWNAALDKAARECDKVLECKAAARIRELKK